MSGVLPTDQCREEFFKMKNKRAYKFITFKINKEEGKTTTTEVLEVHKKEDAFDFKMVLDRLPADEPRYVVMDWEVENADGCKLSKIFFISWVPDTCKPQTKMLYASSKLALRNALEGCHLDYQATDYDDLTPEEFNIRALGK